MGDDLTSEMVQLIAAARVVGVAEEDAADDGKLPLPPLARPQSNVVHIEGLAPLFLKNAIRSHLHFSQLNAWISSRNGRMPDGISCTYRTLRTEEEINGSDMLWEHTFPVCRTDKHSILIVSVKYVKSDQMPLPVGLCLTLGELSTDQWLVPSPLESPVDERPLIALPPEPAGLPSLKHKPLPALSSPSTDGPSPKFSAVAGPNDERPARRVLSACTLSLPPTESRLESNEIDILASRLQTIQGERGRQRTKSGGSIFNKITGLPLHSSPAPLSRQRNSFSASDIVLPETHLLRHQPGSLLGNFEESALNGRLDPVKRLDGFKLQLAASGAFSSPHTSLTVTAYFFDLNDTETAPSPYLGTCSLESLGKRGYRIPKQGTIQATLFNPQDTVLKVFLVTYDMSDMPPSSQTFIRQRTFLAAEEEDRVDKHLVNLIHFRLATDRRCRLYLHTDVRILFSQNNTLDALNLELKGRVGHGSTRYRLVEETELPSQPRYSPKK